MVTIKNPEEIKILREGGKKLAYIMQQLVIATKTDIVAEELNRLAIKLIEKEEGEPSFLGYKPSGSNKPYPTALCVSVNNEIVHGLPCSAGQVKILKNGDIVGLDLGMKYKGLYTDMAVTVGVGKINEDAEKLIKATKIALDKGISVIKEGARVGDIGAAIQTYAESQNFSVIRNLVGHGVGYAVHENPEIPNYGKRGQGLELKAGMVLALEPMLTTGSTNAVLDSDGWTYKTSDSSLSAQFEHTIVVTKNGAEILTLGS